MAFADISLRDNGAGTFDVSLSAAAGAEVLPNKGDITLNGFVPTVSLPVVVLAGIGVLSLLGFSPTV